MWLYLLDNAKRPFLSVFTFVVYLTINYLFMWGGAGCTCHGMSVVPMAVRGQLAGLLLSFHLVVPWTDLRSHPRSQTECLRLLNWLTSKFWFFVVLRQDLTVEPWLVLNSTLRPGWSPTFSDVLDSASRVLGPQARAAVPCLTLHFFFVWDRSIL